MPDIGVDGNFDVYIGPRGDLPFLTGKAAFNQRIIYLITSEFHDVIGEGDPDKIREQIRVRANQIAAQSEEIDSLHGIYVERSDEDPNTMIVEITYDTGEPLVFPVGGE